MKFPTTFMGYDGKEEYRKIMNEKEGEKPTEEPEKIIFQGSDIVSSDYIQIPGKDFIIAIGETDFNLNYEEANKAVLKRGLEVPLISQFMNFHNYVIDCYKNNKPIFDSAGNPISDNTKNDLYNQLTSNCWSWLNGKFNLSGKKNMLEIIIGLDSKDNLLTRTEILEPFLNEDCYVDFNKINKNGIPDLTSKYSNQSFVKGENIYYWSPVNGRVARFNAYSDRAALKCNRYPSLRRSDRGVRTVKKVLGQGSLGGRT
jgi:hypothetical protein